MPNSEYWKQRFQQLEAAQNQKGANVYAEIERQYRQAQKELEGKINTWYQRFANNNGVSMAEARRMIAGRDLKEFKWDVKDYIKYGQENAVNQNWMKELENASARFHISRLEALKLQTQQSLEIMFGNQLDKIDSAMKHIYLEGYYHTAYELQHGFRIGWDIAGLDQAQIEKVISKPWAVDGKNFSERIWGNKEKLITEVHNELTRNIMLGTDPQKAIDNIARKMNTSKNNAGRLVMTEEAYFSSAAQKDCFNDLGVEEYEIVATLDSHTSEICQNLDGQHFPMKDFEPGITAPPFHVYCRSTTIPYFEDNFGQIGERATRNEDGKTYYVPANMTYKEWKEAFVDDEVKSKITVASGRNKANYEGIPKTWEKLPKSADIMAVNPSNDKRNCVNCTIAYEMRRRGYAVVAGNPIKRLQNSPFSGWISPNIKMVEAGSDALTEIKESLRGWGEGSRAQIAVVWNQRKGWSGAWGLNEKPQGHSFIAECKGDTVVFIDIQTGIEYTEDIFNKVSDNPVEYCRIDNLEINDLGSTACKKE